MTQKLTSQGKQGISLLTAPETIPFIEAISSSNTQVMKCHSDLSKYKILRHYQ